MTDSMLHAYASLIAKTGANVQKGQGVIIRASVDQFAFTRLVVEECYKLGAAWVRVDWGDQPITKLHYQYQTTKELSTVEKWRREQLRHQVKTLPATIYLASDDPAGLAGVDMAKMQQMQMKTYPVVKPFHDAMENKYQWTIAAVPGKEWAQKVFPDLAPAKAVEKLWGYILEACHIKKGVDPNEAWAQHNANFAARCKALNDKHFDRITYKSANGTDFTAWLIPEGQWCGGGEETIGDVFFNPNMPTEEVFTSPMKGRAEGTLVSTMPLSYRGQLIENFSVTFEGGKVVSCKAEKGQELLERMLDLDEGARMLGELALVPNSSPIHQSGVLYYETLFDENASCHVALGAGFDDCIQNYKNRTHEECLALGVNDSMIHVDFMIGAPDLDITGWNGDVPTPIFHNGEWA